MKWSGPLHWRWKRRLEGELVGRGPRAQRERAWREPVHRHRRWEGGDVLPLLLPLLLSRPWLLRCRLGHRLIRIIIVEKGAEGGGRGRVLHLLLIVARRDELVGRAPSHRFAVVSRAPHGCRSCGGERRKPVLNPRGQKLILPKPNRRPPDRLGPLDCIPRISAASRVPHHVTALQALLALGRQH